MGTDTNSVGNGDAASDNSKSFNSVYEWRRSAAGAQENVWRGAHFGAFVSASAKAKHDEENKDESDEDKASRQKEKAESDKKKQMDSLKSKSKSELEALKKKLEK